jgi:hypothetical protein
MVSMKVNAKSVRKGVEELLNRRRNVGKGGGGGGRHAASAMIVEVRLSMRQW